MMSRQRINISILKAFAMTVALAMPVGAQAQNEVANLTADKGSFTWLPLPKDATASDAIIGRHDHLGLLPKDRESLSAVFSYSALVIRGQRIDPTHLSMNVFKVSADRAEIKFSQVDSALTEIIWAVDTTLDPASGSFWPGDVIAFNSSIVVSGEVAGNILVVGGDLVIREGATVRGAVAVVGGILRQRGDGKIYGEVFAPDGHRRPRLSITRAWEFENEGIQWSPTFSYDRVDAVRLGGNFSFQRAAFSPLLSLYAGYGFGSETWQYRFGIRQRLMRSADLELHGEVFRLTDTDDDSWVGRHANTVYALVAGSDYRDYYGVDGGELGITYKYRERGILSATYRNTDYRWLDAERGIWHLFRPNHPFRENFSTLPTDILDPWVDRFEDRTSSIRLAIGVEPRESEEHRPRFDGAIKASAEVAGGVLGGAFDYDRWQLSVRGQWSGEETHRLAARFWYGKGRRDLPPNKFFYLGGIGSLPGYSQKSFVGNEAVLANLEYRFDYWPNEIYDAGIILFFDVGRATFDDDFFDLSEFKTDLGVGLAVGEGIRLDVAKGLDHTERDLRVSVRLWQKW